MADYLVKCCRSRKSSEERSSQKQKKATPLPKVKVVIIGSIVLINQFGAALIFPFLPFMVHDFFPQLNKDELGRKAGFLGSAFFAGNFAGSLMWGWISDLWGRRPVMLLGICGTILSELLFGFSQTFAWAISARFLWGFLNGNIGVAKTYLSEICDDTNQAQGFSVIGTSSGIGRLLGSVVGGFLAQPASKYRVFEHQFFCQFPYVLPVFVAVGIGMFSFTTGLCFLNETLPRAKERIKRHRSQNEEESESISNDYNTDIEMISLTSDSESELANDSDLNINGDVRRESDLDSDLNASDTELLLTNNTSEHTLQSNGQPSHLSLRIKTAVRSFSLSSLGKRFLSHHKQQCAMCCCCCCTTTAHTRSQSLFSLITSSQTWKQIGRKIASNIKEMFRLMVDRRVILSTSLYGLLGFVAITMNELFPLLMVTDHTHGGYQMDDNEIATVVMVFAVAQLVYQPVVFPRLVRLLGYRNLLRVSVIVFACGCILLPWCNTITGPIDPVLITGSGSSATGSGSGLMLNDSNQYDYCGRSADEASINENSIKRIPVKVWAMVIFVMLASILARVSGFTSIMVMVNNSALPETRGLVNGIGQSLVAISRSVGPMTGALLFAWSEGNGQSWPLNYHLPFEMCFIVAVVVLSITIPLPKSIEKKRNRENN